MTPHQAALQRLAMDYEAKLAAQDFEFEQRYSKLKRYNFELIQEFIKLRRINRKLRGVKV